MPLKVYNTMTRSRQEFVPLKDNKVGMYACGITAYDLCHMGHARSAIVFDMISKYLRFRGYDVTFVKNFTDVDDKIINRANNEHVPISEISKKYIAEHNTDMDALGVARPDVAPKATDNIAGMIRLIEKLIAKGLAYVVDGDVYYAVTKFPSYGKLSGRNTDEMLAGARVEVDDRKRNPLDFALWKSSKDGEPYWESPWGKGRPGWHIECSVMSSRYLGETFDIHGGGEDLIFPHHENEIAQSEGASGKPFANYWIHNGFIRVNSEKMSKSLGNFFTIRDILKEYDPEVVRLFVLQSHYRSPVDFSEDALDEARQGMERFYETLQRIDGLLAGSEPPAVKGSRLPDKDLAVLKKAEGLLERFQGAMDDDFNTARAIGFIFESVRAMNSYMDESAPSDYSRFVLREARNFIRKVGSVLGLFQSDPGEYFRKDRDREAFKRGIDVTEVEGLISERARARSDRDWRKADDIRSRLSALGISIKDSPAGTSWKID